MLDHLARRAAAALGLPHATILSALLKREELGSTGMGDGVAVPHARLPGVSKSFGILARLNKAIDFNAIDGEPVDVVCLLLLPTNSDEGQHALASAAQRSCEMRRCVGTFVGRLTMRKHFALWSHNVEHNSKSNVGPSRQFAATRHFSRVWGKADINSGQVKDRIHKYTPWCPLRIGSHSVVIARSPPKGRRSNPDFLIRWNITSLRSHWWRRAACASSTAGVILAVRPPPTMN